jgi:alpha-glucosidase
MLRPLFFAASLVVCCVSFAARANDVTSPDGRIVVSVENDEFGMLHYTIRYDGRVVLEPSPLGLETTGGDWLVSLTQTRAPVRQPVRDDYQLLHGKRRDCHYRANRATFEFKNERTRNALRVIFQISDDGVAFRYELPSGGDSAIATIKQEATGFNFPTSARAWLLPIDDNLTGWGRMNPCYEWLYQVDIPVTQTSPSSEGWAFPALFCVNDVWALISESDVNGGYCASRLTSANDDGLMTIAFPDERENNGKTPAAPEITFPFQSPWRVIIIGESPRAIVESTLVTDVASPSRIANTEFIRPGTSAWGWLREQNGAMTVERQREYINMAAKLGLKYLLIDAEWDERIGYEEMADLIKYAAGKNVGICLWYNSNGDFNDASQTPRDKMDTPAARKAEFKRLRAMGAKGVKVDFFGGDKQATMQLYMDILKDAADAEMLVNFHGATIPRGWDRTWPNMLTIEAVRGEENLAWRKVDADREAAHDCILPFTRNVIGPMDFTPNALGHHYDPKHLRDRYCTLGFELALGIVYESGIQHFGITPTDAENAPDFAIAYFRDLPDTWNESKFLAGFPGKYCVMARRAGDRWFIAGINGQNTPQAVSCDLPFVKKSIGGKLIEDGTGDRLLKQRAIAVGVASPLNVMIPAHGGFVFRSDR